MAPPSWAVHQHDEGPDRVGQDVAEGDPEVAHARARARPRRNCISRMDSTLARTTRAARGDDRRPRSRSPRWSSTGPARPTSRGPAPGAAAPAGCPSPAARSRSGLAAGVAREQPDDAAQHRAQQRGGQAHDQRDARAVHDAASRCRGPGCRCRASDSAPGAHQRAACVGAHRVVGREDGRRTGRGQRSRASAGRRPRPAASSATKQPERPAHARGRRGASASADRPVDGGASGHQRTAVLDARIEPRVQQVHRQVGRGSRRSR